MKKFILMFLLIFGIHANAACPVDFTGENICTSNEQLQPLFIRNETSVNNKSEPSNRQLIPNLTPLNINPDNKAGKLQKNSSCQFGICLQDINNSNNKN